MDKGTDMYPGSQDHPDIVTWLVLSKRLRDTATDGEGAIKTSNKVWQRGPRKLSSLPRRVVVAAHQPRTFPIGHNPLGPPSRLELFHPSGALPCLSDP